MDKKLYFEYILDSLLRKINISDNDFSSLKAMKLLFLIVSADTSPFASGLLLGVFDNFEAYPLGAVEIDIYRDIKGNSLSKFELNNKCLILKYHKSLPVLHNDVTRAIDNAIELLLSYNPNILKLRSWDLVDITHKYSSWCYAFNQYKLGGNYVRMESRYIMNDIKYFK